MPAQNAPPRKRSPLLWLGLAALGLYLLSRTGEAGAAETVEPGIPGAPSGPGFPTGSQAQPTADVVQTGARATTAEGDATLPWYLGGGSGGGGGPMVEAAPAVAAPVVATGAQVSTSTPATQETAAAVVNQATGGISGVLSPQAPVLLAPVEPATPVMPVLAPAEPVPGAPEPVPEPVLVPPPPRPVPTPAYSEQDLRTALYPYITWHQGMGMPDISGPLASLTARLGRPPTFQEARNALIPVYQDFGAQLAAQYQPDTGR